MARRFDQAELGKPQYLPNGWVRVDAYIARSGLLEYRRADGSPWVEYRPPDAHTPESLATFDAVPFTNNHPPVQLDAENTKLYQVGTVLDPRVDGARVRASILVTDAKTVDAIKRGKVELSCGYSCDVDMTPGTTPDGKHYDAVQSNVIGNHVALVSAGRAGPEVRLRLDGVDPDLPNETVSIPFNPSQPTKGQTMIKIKIDGVEYEVSEQAAQAVAKLQTSHDTLAAKISEEKARADGASGEVTRLKAELADAPVKARAALEARVALENRARKVLGTEPKFDGVSDLDLKRAIAIKGGFKVDGENDAYVEAASRITLERADETKAIDDSTKGTSPVSKQDGSGDPLVEARNKFNRELEALSQRKGK